MMPEISKEVGEKGRKRMKSQLCTTEIPAAGLRGSIQMGPLQSMKNAFQNVPSMGQESGQLTHWLLLLLVESFLRQWTVPTHSSHLALSCCACVVWEGYCGSRESSEAKQTNKQQQRCAAAFQVGQYQHESTQPTRAVVEIKMSWGNAVG